MFSNANEAIGYLQQPKSRESTRGSRSEYFPQPRAATNGLEGLWWVYRPTQQQQIKRMSMLSQPRKRVALIKSSKGLSGRIDKETPGPGAYRPEKPSRIKYVGALNLSKPKSELDEIETREKDLPGPGSYYTLGAEYKISGGRFSSARAKSSIEWAEYRASRLPGPSDYDTRASSANTTTGGRFSSSNTKSEVDWLIHYAAQTPGPGHYDLRTSSVPGGRFTGSGGRSALEWAIYRAKLTPGVGAYELPGIANSPKKGGHFSLANPLSDVDILISEASRSPGPGSYDIPSMFGNAFGGREHSNSRPNSRPSTTFSSGRFRGVPRPKRGPNLHKDLDGTERLGDIVMEATSKIALDDCLKIGEDHRIAVE